jgi:competence protein ComEA
MDTSAPWRALETPESAPGGDAAGRTVPSTLLMVLVVAALLAGSLGIVAFAALQPGGTVEVLAGQSDAATSPAVAPAGAVVVVQVAGAVVKPGVYSLPAGSRVGDAIKAAGGYSPDVDPRAAETKLNLAARLQDAQSIVVPRRGDAAAASGATRSSAPAGPVDLNTAGSAELDALPGIGPATAAKIIASREQKPFVAVDDLVKRKLVSAATLAAFRDRVTV